MIDREAFYGLLAATPRDWYVGRLSGAIRRRSTLKQCECPISSIYRRPTMYAHTVSVQIGLSLADTNDIMAAADDIIGSDLSIRAELLRACGLDSQPLNEKEKLKP